MTSVKTHIGEFDQSYGLDTYTYAKHCIRSNESKERKKVGAVAAAFNRDAINKRTCKFDRKHVKL